jgi:hypothetical protein
MPSLVIASATAIVCTREVDPAVALEQAQTASGEFPDATDIWLFDAVGKAPWHASLTPAPRNKKRAA